MAKVVTSKLRTLYIMDALLEKSDSEHRLSTQDLLATLSANGIDVERKSIYDDLETLGEWGMDIIYTKEKPAGYYLGSRKFELPELKLLVDAVQSSKFITEKKSRELIKKLEGLASENEAKQLHRQVFIANRIKTQNESIYYNVDKIQEAIMANQNISFTYYKWNTDKELIARNGGNPFIISPWSLTWDDENYYMIGFDELSGLVKHYRVDKMQKINLTGDKRTGEAEFDKFDLAKFAKSTFGMYGGKHETVTLECENNLIGAILDRFGTDVIVVKTDDDHFSMRHEVAVSGQFFGWVVGLGSKAKITGPEYVVEEFKSWLDDIREGI